MSSSVGMGVDEPPANEIVVQSQSKGDRTVRAKHLSLPILVSCSSKCLCPYPRSLFENSISHT